MLPPAAVTEERPGAGILAWPVPFSNNLHAAGWLPGTQVQLVDATGRVVSRISANTRGEAHLNMVPGASGAYILTGKGNDGKVRRKELVRVCH